jgi:hypothetical protein
VALGKMLKLGGLENSAPNTGQSPNKFKVAKNVSFTKDGYITPRSSMEGFTGNTGTSPLYPISRWTHFTSYNDFITRSRKLLKFGIEDRTSTRQKQLFLENTIVPSYNGLSMDLDAVYTNNFSDQSVELDGVKYILSCPNKSNSQLIKYDGFEAAPAGIGAPFFMPVASNNFSTTEPGYSTTTGSRYVKVVGHSLDMQGNPVTSDAVSYRTTGTTQNFNAITSGFTPDGTAIFVGVGDSGISYSYNGIDWDANVRLATTLTNYPLTAVCYGNSLFVALCGNTSLTQAPVLLSEDGINWRVNSDASVGSIGGGWTSVVWGGNKYVAVRSGVGTAAQRVMTSPDGVVWTYRTATSTNDWSSVAYGGSGPIAFVACATNGLVATQIMTSPDGITWTARTSTAANQWRSVAWGVGVWVIVGNGIITNNAMSSADGITWTARTTAAAVSWRAVTFGSNPFTGASAFIAVAQDAVTANKIMTSANGTTWTGITSPNTLANYCVCFGMVGLTGFYVSGANLAPLQVAQGLMYCKDSALTAWTAVDSPITTFLDMTISIASQANFLSTTSNEPYNESDFAMAQYFYGKATYNSITDKFDLTVPFDWAINNSGQGNIYVIRPISFTITTGVQTTKYSAIAYKYTDTGTNFYGDIKIYNPATLLWESSSGSTLPQASGLFAASRRHYTVWASPSASGIYYYKGIATAATSNLGSYFAPTKYLVDIRNLTMENSVQKASNLPFSISGSLNAWYDVSSIKRSFNSFVSGLESFVSITLYQGSILLATQDVIYISDYTFGGSLEMTTGLSAIKVGDSEQGNVTSIVGTKDYLIVSRERKVYMVAGTLTTNNVRIQEIPGIPIGAYSNSCMQEVDGNIILLTSVGAWWINAANAKKLSSGIELNFRTFMKRYINQQPSAEADSVIFDMNDYPANAYSSPNIKKYITCSYDAYRNILVFTDSSTDKCGESLALHLSNEEFTNWTSYDTDGYELSAMTFIDGKQYNGTITDTNLARTSNENVDPAIFTYDYSTRSPSRLVTTWMTAGEPSLEKQILQLKMFGYIWSDLDIKHYQNWDLSTAITNATYVSPGSTSPNNYIMYHKQRLNSSKAMSVCIELLHKSGGKTFWIEGFEVEFEAIQAGMKR